MSDGPTITLVAAYHDRAKQWSNTQESLRFWYGDSPSWLKVRIVEDKRSHEWRNPGVLYNQACEGVDTDLIFLTNPENLHVGPVLEKCREVVRDGTYLVFGCRSLKTVPASFNDALKDIDAYTDFDKFNGWYQHTKHRMGILHFASCITKNDWARVGGFDPAFDEGLDYEDIDFATSVAHTPGMNVAATDSPFVAHQAHYRKPKTEESERLRALNRARYFSKWGTKAFLC